MVLGLEVRQGGIDGESKTLWFNKTDTADFVSICINQHIPEQALAGFWSPLCLIYKSLPRRIDWGWQRMAAAELSRYLPGETPCRLFFLLIRITSLFIYLHRNTNSTLPWNIVLSGENPIFPRCMHVLSRWLITGLSGPQLLVVFPMLCLD